MNPNDQNQNPVPAPTPTINQSSPEAQPTPTPELNKTSPKRKKLALWLLIGPTALFIVVFLLFAIINYITLDSGSTGANSSSLFGTDSPLKIIANVILYFTGIIAFLTWLPGIIAGIILLATKPKSAL